MEKLIITATTANSWIYPALKNWAQSDEGLVDDAVACAAAGASIIHIHFPRGREKAVVTRIRDRTDALIQAGDDVGDPQSPCRVIFRDSGGSSACYVGAGGLLSVVQASRNKAGMGSVGRGLVLELGLA